MQILERIDAIEQRAKAINLTLTDLCRGARVYPSTIARWRQGSDPKLKNAAGIVARLEAELERREVAVERHLQAMREVSDAA